MFLKSLKIVLINLVKILMSAKMATLGLLKIKVVWSKNYYDVIIFDYDVTKKIYHVTHFTLQMGPCDHK